MGKEWEAGSGGNGMTICWNLLGFLLGMGVFSVLMDVREDTKMLFAFAFHDTAHYISAMYIYYH
jgi:hypothetical protein